MREISDKPKISAASTQWKLVSCGQYSEVIENYLEDKSALVESVDIIVQDKSSVPELTNNLLYYIAESEGIEESLAKEIAVLQERKARFHKRSENLRDSIKMVFDRFDIKKMECPFGTISQVTRHGSKLDIQDEGMILMDHPELYIRQDPKLDKIALKKLLEEGITIEGVKLIDTHSIMIRK